MWVNGTLLGIRKQSVSVQLFLHPPFIQTEFHQCFLCVVLRVKIQQVEDGFFGKCEQVAAVRRQDHGLVTEEQGGLHRLIAELAEVVAVRGWTIRSDARNGRYRFGNNAIERQCGV